jgi:hypothetical protein
VGAARSATGGANAWPPVYFPHPPTLSNYLNVWFGAEEYAACRSRKFDPVGFAL